MYLTVGQNIFLDVIFIRYIFIWKSSEKLDEGKSRWQKSHNTELHGSWRRDADNLTDEI